MAVTFLNSPGISIAFSNINYREEMKYLQTFSISAKETKVLTTTITTKPYNVEFILPIDATTGKIITAGMGEPILTLTGGVYTVTVYSAVAMTDVELKILY